MKKLDLLWMMKKEWIKADGLHYVLREDAPKIAQDSYKRYLKQIKESSGSNAI